MANIIVNILIIISYYSSELELCAKYWASVKSEVAVIYISYFLKE